jgi:cGMP-dependent protein kinase
MLYNAPRSAGVKCIGNCGFWALDRNTFRKTIEDIVQKDLPMNRKFMESVSFFNFMNPE